VTYSKTSCCIFNLVLPCINIFLLMIWIEFALFKKKNYFIFYSFNGAI
jgi:hypothetical protein